MPQLFYGKMKDASLKTFEEITYSSHRLKDNDHCI